MNDRERVEIVRALLGELSPADQMRHAERMKNDAAWRAEFQALVATRTALVSVEPPALAPGFDARVLAALRARSGADPVVLAMRRQFWRLAGPAAVAAAIVLALAVRAETVSPAPTDVTFATWYPISADPTVEP